VAFGNSIPGGGSGWYGQVETYPRLGRGNLHAVTIKSRANTQRAVGNSRIVVTPSTRAKGYSSMLLTPCGRQHRTWLPLA
jgi:hypothetical protein